MLSIPSYSAPVLHMMNSQFPSHQNDPGFGVDIRSYTPIVNTIASLISSRLVSDPDSTTLKTAREYIKKAKPFIELVVKLIGSDNEDIRDKTEVVKKVLSSLEQMIGSDDHMIDQEDLEFKMMQKT